MITDRRVTVYTRTMLSGIFDRLDYRTLGRVYCYEGGEEFWKAKREPCNRLGVRLGKLLLKRLPAGGRSLYVGAGVAELAPLLIEANELRRVVLAYNLRRAEVASLNRACRGTPLVFRSDDAAVARGRFDHVWIVSVLNDPERFPHLSALSYGRADPVSFDPRRFRQERRIVRKIVSRCLSKLSLPGLVTTSTEEVVWIADWCHRHRIPYLVGRPQSRTALVGDPVCFIDVGAKRKH
jgi:hypothetical protein